MKKIILALALLSLIGIVAVILIPALYLAERREFTPVTIPAGEYSLQGYLSKGNGAHGPYVIFFHGNRSQGQAHPLYQHILQMFPREMTVLGVDVLGYGGSRVDQMVDPVRILDHEPDWRAALAYLENNLGASPDQIILVGHSMGATMVMDAARKASFRLSVPIGLGDWNLILDNPEKISDHVNKIKANTGVSIDPALLRPNKAQYSPEVVFASCPLTPVRLIYAGRDDGPHTLFPYINEAQEECADLIGWRFVPYSDHMYGTELAGYPRPVRDLYSRLSLSLLKWQLLGLIGSSKP